MKISTEIQLLALSKRINDRLDQIHDEAIRGFRSLAKSTGSGREIVSWRGLCRTSGRTGYDAERRY